jgi:hypothetical protein
LTCWRPIRAGRNAGKTEVGVCIPTRAKSVCDLNALIAHELQHVRDLIAVSGRAMTAADFRRSLDELDVGVFERAAYTQQCQVYAAQRCLSGADATRWVGDCTDRLVGLSTAPEARERITGGCARFSW